MNISIFPKRRFAYLWLKYVRGFDENVHCARCLIGKFAWNIVPYDSGMKKAGTLLSGELESGWPYVYLCALAPGPAQGRAGDLHLAFAADPGQAIHINTDWIEVTVTDASELIIPEIPQGECDRGPRFTTCMNYKFGWAYLRNKHPPPPASLL